jgi:hypothetical protein
MERVGVKSVKAPAAAAVVVVVVGKTLAVRIAEQQY